MRERERGAQRAWKVVNECMRGERGGGNDEDIGDCKRFFAGTLYVY